MTKDLHKNLNAAWKSFERSGSISAFLVYHKAKPEKLSRTAKLVSVSGKDTKKK